MRLSHGKDIFKEFDLIFATLKTNRGNGGPERCVLLLTRRQEASIHEGSRALLTKGRNNKPHGCQLPLQRQQADRGQHHPPRCSAPIEGGNGNEKTRTKKEKEREKTNEREEKEKKKEKEKGWRRRTESKEKKKDYNS